MIIEVDGDITEFPEAEYICHQCNCVSDGQAGGLARTIFDKFPIADSYLGRKEANTPGTIGVFSCDDKKIINMYGQYYPGKPLLGNNPKDGTEVRESYFKRCLSAISLIDDVKSIVFPRLIGCDLAGGDWEKYESFIRDLDETWTKNGFQIKVYIVNFNK